MARQGLGDVAAPVEISFGPLATLSRECGLLAGEAFRRCMFLTEGQIARLEPHILTGHRGCVNRLAWNANGSLLASGSDDRQVLLP